MSHQAIAAALVRDDLSVGERLVAFALASFADRDHLARPGTSAAAGRAGLSKSRFLEARDGLVRCGLLVVKLPATGRGRACTLGLPFACEGPWWDGEINAELFEAVLSYSCAQGSGRLLVAAMAALADERRVVEGFTTAELCSAAGITARTYGRVRGPLLASGELVLRTATRGRGNTNCWEIPDPRAGAAGSAPPMRRRRVLPPPGARPLVASVRPPCAADEGSSDAWVGQIAGEGDRESRVVDAGRGRQDRTLSAEKGPGLSGVSGEKGCQARTLSARNGPGLSRVSPEKGKQVRTLSRENPAENPAKTPARNARGGREPQNPRTLEDPPNPPEGGSGADQFVVQETYVTERGRKRRRSVTVDLAAVRERLRAAGEADLGAWEQVRGLLLEAVGESTFEIWLANLELIAVDLDGALVVCAPHETVGWVRQRFGRLLDRAAHRAARSLRIADEVERKAAERRTSTSAIPPDISPADARAGSGGRVNSDGCWGGVQADLSVDMRVGRSGDSLADRSTRWTDPVRGDTSAYPGSCTDIYNQAKEVSQ